MNKFCFNDFSQYIKDKIIKNDPYFLNGNRKAEPYLLTHWFHYVRLYCDYENDERLKQELFPFFFGEENNKQEV